MNNVNKIKRLIDKMIYKDISNMIPKYLFSKCSLCFQDEYPENLDLGVNDTIYCRTCQSHEDILMKCCRCNYFYVKLNGNYYCKSCSGFCNLYCNNCFLLTQSVFGIDGPHYYAFWRGYPDDDIFEDLIRNL